MHRRPRQNRLDQCRRSLSLFRRQVLSELQRLLLVPALTFQPPLRPQRLPHSLRLRPRQSHPSNPTLATHRRKLRRFQSSWLPVTPLSTQRPPEQRLPPQRAQNFSKSVGFATQYGPTKQQRNSNSSDFSRP